LEYGKPDEEIDLKDFVLNKIEEEDRNILDIAIKNAAKAIEEILKNGIDIAMNKYN